MTTDRPDRDPPGAGVAGDPTASRRWPPRAVIRVVGLRLRFVALMAATGLAFGSWDTLVNRFETWRRPPGERPAAGARFAYYCPMHPSVVTESPGPCPSCGMPLARRGRGPDAASPRGTPPRVRLTPGQVAQAGIRTVAVGLAAPARTLTTVGSVGFDEDRRVVVASDARGRLRVDRLLVRSEGVAVRAGQRLAELYGYDVSQAIRTFLDANRAARDPTEATADPRRTPLGDPDERVRLAVEGLKVLGVRQEQIDALAAGDPGDEGDGSDDLLPILAPIDGQIIRKEVYEGQYVPEGAVLFEVADPGRVRIEAQVFEDQVGGVRVGGPAEATVPAFPGAVFRGTVALIAPALDPATRTAEVRCEFDNRDRRLRPGMFATVTLAVAPFDRRPTTCPVSQRALGAMGPPIRVEVLGRTVWVCCAACGPELRSAPAKYLARLDASPTGRVPSVPESAVIDTGARQVVYVEVEPGLFEGRAVVLGPRSGDRYAVLDGLAPGERVAAAGAFLIDAETRLDPATQPAPPLPTPAADGPPVDPSRPAKVD